MCSEGIHTFATNSLHNNLIRLLALLFFLVDLIQKSWLSLSLSVYIIYVYMCVYIYIDPSHHDDFVQLRLAPGIFLLAGYVACRGQGRKMSLKSPKYPVVEACILLKTRYDKSSKMVPYPPCRLTSSKETHVGALSTEPWPARGSFRPRKPTWPKAECFFFHTSWCQVKSKFSNLVVPEHQGEDITEDVLAQLKWLMIYGDFLEEVGFSPFVCFMTCNLSTVLKH